MRLSIGIVGLPNVGKSTLFKVLTKQEVNIANYPFATIDPNVGVVPVPDERLEKLAKLSNSKKVVPAVVEFYDIAGLVKGANKGEGLGNQFLSHIREVNAIVQIIRCFKQSDIVHVEGGINPLRDLEIIRTELALKDLETVERRLVKAESDARSGKKEFIEVCEILKEIKGELEKENLLSQTTSLIPAYGGQARLSASGGNKGYNLLMKEMNLLTVKPQLILLNGNEENVNEELRLEIKKLGVDYLVIDLAKTEEIPELIQKAYRILNLISFLTTGEPPPGGETRAWTIQRGTKAKEAAGAIHSDFEKNFIRAEVIFWEKLIEAGGWNEAKQKGWLRLEGKDYVVNDGDVMIIRHG